MAEPINRRGVSLGPIVPQQNDALVKVWAEVGLPIDRELLEDAGIISSDAEYQDMNGRTRLSFDSPEVRQKLHYVFKLYSKALKIKWEATKKLDEIKLLKTEILNDVERHPRKADELKLDLEELEYAEHLCKSGLERDLYDIYAMFREQYDKMRMAGHTDASRELRRTARAEDTEEMILRRKSIREFQEDGVL